MKSCLPISVDQVRDLFSYDPNMGLLTSNVNRPKLKKGEIVGALNSTGRLICHIDYKIYYVHRIVWAHFYGTVPPDVIDHIDGNSSNNRISNLRAATASQNGANRHHNYNSRSGVKGVHYSSVEKKWRSSIKVNGKSIHLGWFRDKDLASAAYTAAALHYFEDYAKFDTEVKR